MTAQNVTNELTAIKPGLILVILTLLFGVGLGILFGANEDGFQAYIAEGIARHPALHDAQSPGKIWRYAQRAHFHATGIAAFCLGLLLVVMHSRLASAMKRLTAILIGLAGCYPLAWFTIFLLAPSLGRAAAHEHFLTLLFTYTGVGGLIAGLALLIGNLLLGRFGDTAGDADH